MLGNAKKILVAEDNTALCGVLRFNLQLAGFDVTITSDGRQALECALSEQFDLIISDHQMPELTGCELFAELRKLENYQNTPKIMLTAKGLELELPRLTVELGITATFSKPFSPSEVVRTVEECLAAAKT